jgi:hypothetical protein
MNLYDIANRVHAAYPDWAKANGRSPERVHVSSVAAAEFRGASDGSAGWLATTAVRPLVGSVGAIQLEWFEDPALEGDAFRFE